jgi:hypothetical protein
MKSGKLLRHILDSYFSAIGEEYPNLFEKNNEYKELYEMTEDEDIAESMDKSKERGTRDLEDKKKRGIRRKLQIPDERPDLTKEPGDKVRSRGSSPINKHKSHHKYPWREDITTDVKECVKFLINNLKKPDIELRDAVEKFPHRVRLFQLVDHLIATSLGGWKLDGKKLVNESGHEASADNWELTDCGKLKPINSNRRILDVDKLYELRGICNGKQRST